MANLSNLTILITIVTIGIVTVDSVVVPNFTLDKKRITVDKCSTNGTICLGAQVRSKVVSTDNTHGCLQGHTGTDHGCTFLLIGQLHKTFPDKIDWSLTIRGGSADHTVQVGPKKIGSNDWNNLMYMFTNWRNGKNSEPSYGVGMKLRGEEEQVIRPSPEDNDFTKVGYRTGFMPTTYFISTHFVNYVVHEEELLRTDMADGPFTLVMNLQYPNKFVNGITWYKETVVSATVSFNKEFLVTTPPPVVVDDPVDDPVDGNYDDTGYHGGGVSSAKVLESGLLTALIAAMVILSQFNK